MDTPLQNGMMRGGDSKKAPFVPIAGTKDAAFRGTTQIRASRHALARPVTAGGRPCLHGCSRANQTGLPAGRLSADDRPSLGGVSRLFSRSSHGFHIPTATLPRKWEKSKRENGRPGERKWAARMGGPWGDHFSSDLSSSGLASGAVSPDWAASLAFSSSSSTR